MDIAYILKAENQSGLGGLDYMQSNVGTVVPYFILLILATVSGTFGNCLLIVTVTTTKRLNQVGNIFICNLAIADLCVSSFVDIFNIISVVEGERWFIARPGVCDMVAIICLISCYCSLYSIGAVSFNRYIHICHHTHYGTIFTKRKTLLYCVILWIVSFLLELSNITGWGGHGFDSKTLTCLWDRTADYSNTLFVALVGIATPVVVIFICYLKIFLHVHKIKRRVWQGNVAGDTRHSNVSKSTAESMKLARTLFIIFVVFAVCWTPYAIIILADYNDTYPQEVHMFAILMAHVNSSCNAILYGITNRRFREGYIQVLRLNKCFPTRFSLDSTSKTGRTAAEPTVNTEV